MSLKDRPAQIIELSSTRLALIALPMCLMVMQTALIDPLGPTRWATHPIRPTQVPHPFVTLRIIHQALNIQ